MERDNIKALVAKYNEGLADPSELEAIERYIENGDILIEQLHSLNAIEQHLMKLEVHSPTMDLDDRFYKMLANEKRSQTRFRFSFPKLNLQYFFSRYALSLFLLAVGILIGYYLKSPTNSTEVKVLTDQVGELKELMMLTLLEKESATERLRAVSLTSEMDQVSQKVTEALFKTLNEDENVNVRLAALEALKVYVKDNEVRAGLIKSIAQQESPLVQLALAELMVGIQEKQSVKEFQKLLKGDRTPKEVKTRIEESIKVLI